MERIGVGVLAVVAALGGVLLTAANRWGAGDPVPCRDTVTNVIALCVTPQSPLWALVLGALLPASAVALAGAAWRRRAAGRQPPAWQA